MSSEDSNNGQAHPPSAADMAIAGDALQAYLNAPNAADRFLFRAFSPDIVSGLKGKIQAPQNLVRNDWDMLSLFLRSVALSLDPFPDLDKRYTHGELYDAIDRIADYALNLPDAPPNTTQQKRGISHER